MTVQTHASALAAFDQAWLAALDAHLPTRLDFGLVGLTRLGEHPASIERPMLAPQDLRGLGSMTFDQADDICIHMPFFASAEAAEPWLASHPGGRVFTVDEMFDRPIVTRYLNTLRP